MQAKTQHPTDDALEQYALGRLPEAATSSLEEHLLVCTACQERMQNMDEYVAAIRLALQEAKPEAVKAGESSRPPLVARFFGLPKPALAAALAVIALAVVVLPWRQGAAEPYRVQLRALRGAEQPGQATAPAGRALILALDITGLVPAPSYRMELVNASGASVWSGTGTAIGEVHIDKAFDPGQYFVRLSDPRGELLREYSLRVE